VNEEIPENLPAIVDVIRAETVADTSEPVAIGQWFWRRAKPERYLVCVTHVGSNFAMVETVGGRTERILLEDWERHCRKAKAPNRYIDTQVGFHKERVQELLSEVQAVTARLGLQPTEALGNSTSSTSLAVVHGVGDVQAHKLELIEAKSKTLPELFKEIEGQHAAMAMWMKASLIPMKAIAAQARQATSSIDSRIMMVELYAGLTEELTQILDGEPAPNDTRIHLFQRQHYMDEECLAQYEAGGMDFRGIGAFDKWLARPQNLNRILPFPRSIVAFQVRRKAKDYGEARSLSEAIRFWEMGEADKLTFLYIRNGDTLHRLSTAVEFGENLFPDHENEELLGEGPKWIVQSSFGFERVISEREHDAVMLKREEENAKYKRELAAWKSESEKTRSHFEPYKPYGRDTHVPLSRDSVYYDDAMRSMAESAVAHNRIAVVIQGLLDRSIALHPHPPWQLWTPEGFTGALELVFDASRGIANGEPPNFEAYFARLGESIKAGSMVIGAQELWERAEAEKENDRRRRSYRYRSDECYEKSSFPMGEALQRSTDATTFTAVIRSPTSKRTVQLRAQGVAPVWDG
jgi:hypothetical protein